MTVSAPLTKPQRLQLHVVFKCHLDVGFTDLAANVVEDYLNFYIPRAIGISRRLRELGRSERFIWTTGSWLIHEYFETRSRAECANLERAILDGDIAWHGLPFTQHSELADASIFEAGLSLSRELDARFGKETIAAKVTDVTGHSRGIVPLLAGEGIRFLHIGINGACAMPEVPSLFKWRDEATNTEVIVMQHHSYGGVYIEDDLGLQMECMGENEPCASVQSIVPFFLNLGKKYPGAEIFGSTLNDYAGRLIERSANLPVVTSEIGDSWIHGGGTDPVKVARLRDLMRLHRKWVSLPGLNSVLPFARKLLKVTEHTWGLDTIMYMADDASCAPEIFLPDLKAGRFATYEESWREQRNYLEEAIATLDPEKAEEAREALNRKESWPSMECFHPIEVGDMHETKFFSLGIDPSSGALCHLKSGDRIWADPDNRLFELSFQLYSAADFTVFLDRYIIEAGRNEWWIPAGLARRDLTQIQKVGGLWTAQFKQLLHAQKPEGDYFLIQLTAPAGVPKDYGFPDDPYLRLFFPNNEPSIQAEVGWLEKMPSWYPEAIWLQINPKVGDPMAWRMDKLGSRISPFDVVKKGGRHLHAVGEDVTCDTGCERVVVRPLDAPLVSFGHRGLLCFDNRETDAAEGLFFNLYNNVWGTNFPLWFGEPASFRFSLSLTGKG